MSRTRYARSGALRIAYELRGTVHWRRPWLVLIQGMGLDRRGWGPVLRRLRRHFRLVLVDNRGFGRMAAQELAIRHAERVDGLALASTTPGWPFAYPMPAVSVRLLAAAARMPAEAARRRHTENALAARAERPELLRRLMEVQGPCPADRSVLSAQAIAGSRYAGCRLGRIRARTVVLHGGADAVVDPRNGWLLAARIPGARLVTFPGLGHLLFWEDPDGFAAAVASFLLGRRPGS